MDSRDNMIQTQLRGRDITNPRVLQAMREVDRALFVPSSVRHRAYDDGALPIGQNQTISQPYIVAYMAQGLDLQPHEKVLEVGTGCGYNAAVLSRLADHVYSVEIIQWLAQLARENLQQAGITNVSTRHDDGYKGWPEQAPFDKIMITAATPYVPEPLKKQLKTGGNLMVPVGTSFQKLLLLEKLDENVFEEHSLINVRFVPLTGKVQRE